MTGQTLSHYQIDAELGRGGMGVVYRATDTKLNRTVALKVLPAAALASPDDRARFVREAQSAAQLNHPNIATVYGIDEAVPEGEGGGGDSRLFIAMEYIDGETLREHAQKGPMKLQQAVSIAGQIAEALKEAHTKEIVHRDIKSANVMLTADGVAKVLDFGLAKTNASTMLTRMGSTLGTVAYMSPEQARGQEVDGRTDLYSLGTVLYELVAGVLPFAGDYEQAVLYSILNEPPEPLTAIRTGVPMQLEWIINKLLAKEAEYRYQTAADLLADLKSLDLSGSGRTQRSMPAMSAARMPAAAGRFRGGALPIWGWGAMAAAAALAAVLAWVLKPEVSVDRDLTVRSLSLEIPFTRVGVTMPSPDGRLLAVVGSDSLGNRGLYLWIMETGESRLLVPTGGTAPNFSGDGQLLAFWQQGNLFTVPVSGGTPARVAEDVSRATAWRSDNSLLYLKRGSSELWLSPADGSQARLVTEPDSSDLHEVSVLPGDRFALVCSAWPNEARESIEIIDLETGERTPIGAGARPRYLPTGHLVYGDPETGVRGPLFVRPFDLESREFTGPQVALYQDAPVWLYDFDRYGTFFHRIRETSAETVIAERSVMAYPPDGASPELIVSVPQAEMPKPAKSDSRVAVVVEDGDDWLMIYDPDSQVEQRITFSGDQDYHAWSDDPDRILLERGGPLEIWSTRGLGLLETLPISGPRFDWSRDGRWIVYTVRGGPGLRLHDLESGTDTLLHETGFEPSFSPDATHVAFEVEEDNGSAIAVVASNGSTYVRLGTDAQDVWQPVWSADGRHIYARTDREVLRVPVSLANGFAQAGPADVALFLSEPFVDYHVDTDDTIYLIPIENAAGGGQSDGTTRISVIVNWFEMIRQIAPPAS